MTEVTKLHPGAEAALAASNNPRFNAIDSLLSRFPQVECPVVHRFTPGLYIRECHVPAGTLFTSKIHQTEHPFVMTKGRISVYIEGVGVIHYAAPHHGITKPGTRRLVYAHEDTVWTTYHPTNETDLARIEEQIIFPHDHHVQLSDAELMALTSGEL